jgi:hypothetical protein
LHPERAPNPPPEKIRTEPNMATLRISSFSPANCPDTYRHAITIHHAQPCISLMVKLHLRGKGTTISPDNQLNNISRVHGQKSAISSEKPTAKTMDRAAHA